MYLKNIFKGILVKANTKMVARSIVDHINIEMKKDVIEVAAVAV